MSKRIWTPTGVSGAPRLTPQQRNKRTRAIRRAAAELEAGGISPLEATCIFATNALHPDGAPMPTDEQMRAYVAQAAMMLGFNAEMGEGAEVEMAGPPLRSV